MVDLANGTFDYSNGTLDVTHDRLICNNTVGIFRYNGTEKSVITEPGAGSIV
jgi:hypothetical protein